MRLTDHNLELFFEQVLFRAFAKDDLVKGYQFISGGCINNAVKLETSTGDYFLKWNESMPEDMFEKEFIGLELLRNCGAVNVPSSIRYGTCQSKPYLLIKFLPPHRQADDYWCLLGRQLANLHKSSNESYGLDHDNYIGRLDQRNTPSANWIEFFIEHRLEVQLGLAIYSDHIDSQYAKQFRRIYSILPNELPEEPPSLLHGDLWSGNVMPGIDGLPTIYDPAVYYGSREMEISFTHLFGGFEDSFYSSYHESFPLVSGFNKRIDLYNLYPLMVHVNLFGASYLSGIDRTLRKYL